MVQLLRTNALAEGVSLACCAILALSGCAGSNESADGENTRSTSSGQTALATVNPSECLDDGCTIHLEKVVTLSDKASPGLFGDRVFVQRGPGGRFVTTSRAFDQVVVFDSSGRLLGTAGRRGAGPEEFELAMLTGAMAGDSVLVYDTRRQRLAIIDPSLKVQRQERLPFFPQLRLSDGSFVIAEQMRGPGRTGYPVHTLSPAGTILRSFGADTPQYHADRRLLHIRVVGPAPDGKIWLAPMGKYVVEKWDPLTGERLKRIVPQVPWFREGANTVGHPLVQRPTSMITQIREDSTGVLWVFAMDGDDGWTRRLAAEPEHETRLSEEELAGAYDWVIDAFDAKSGRHLANYRADAEFWIRPPNELLVTRHLETLPEVAFDVWALQLRRRQPGR
jgi:hypothetical protein